MRTLLSFNVLAMIAPLGMAEFCNWNIIMSLLKTVTLSASVILLSVVAAQAAPHVKKPMHHMAAHSMHRGMHATMANADHSADALNAQSLARSKGATQ